MRLSEEKIKQAILHPQLEIRQRAVGYFSERYSEDESVVPLVIQAVERYGREDAYHLVGGSVDLRHTEETIVARGRTSTGWRSSPAKTAIGGSRFWSS